VTTAHARTRSRVIAHARSHCFDVARGATFSLQRRARRYRSAEAIGRRKLGKLNCRPTVVIKTEAAVFVLFFFLSRQARALQYINRKNGSNAKTQQRKHKYKQSENNDQVHHGS